ncbi:nicotinamide riboside transporter PnuC [uncultured Sphingomonas sp.]|uniref:nicotinamide riboside transporter PnuC n=1 Tax=uncultured Sphingomonas sp. TaxID=158754 RepID=UPI0035C969A4
MPLIEIVAALLGVACVALVVGRSVWNYPLGIASVALYAYVFFVAKLYSDALLQIFFIVVNAYGWRNWQRNRTKTGAVMVEAMTMPEVLRWLAGGTAAIAGWGWMMHHYTDASYPWPDAAIAITSIIAQVLMARRKWQNWVLWIAVDVASIPLYALKSLGPTIILYCVYLVLAVWGLVAWRRVRRAQGSAVA